MKTLATIQGCEALLHGDGHCSMLADADIDCDGSGGNPDNDPYFQPGTTYHYQGKALNAYKVPFIVLPPSLIKGVAPVVLGCKARVLYRETGLIAYGIVGDVGPRTKVGELSVQMARRIGMPSNPNTGGTDDFRLCLYEWWPGQTVSIDGITYPLQPS